MQKKPTLIQKSRRAFSLVEIVIVVAILALVIGIAIPALNSSRADSLKTAADATAKSLNDAVTRAKIKGDTNAVLFGNDAVAAANYLLSQGYIQNK